MHQYAVNSIPRDMDDINQLVINCQAALAAMWSREGMPAKYDALRNLLRDAEAESRKLVNS